MRLAYNPNANRSKAVPVEVRHRDGTTLVMVDQTVAPSIDGRFISLGVFAFDDAAVVVVSNTGTQGYVVVDAVQLLNIEEKPRR